MTRLATPFGAGQSALRASAAALVLIAGTAHAQDATLEKAKMYFDAGAQAYAGGRYDVAIDTFGQAYKLAPRPSVLFSLAQAERKQFYVTRDPQHARRALDLYRQYLEKVPSGGRRTDATNAVEELDPVVARLDPNGATAAATTAASSAAPKLIVSSQSPGATVSLDGHPPVPTPLSSDIQPGKHKVKVTADGFFDEEREVVVRAGDPYTPVELTLREKPAALALQTESGADVLVDGRVVATTPLVRDLEVPAGAHNLAVTKNGYKAFTRDVRLERGKRQVIAAPLDRTPQRFVSYALLGTGVVAAITSGVFIGLAIHEQGVAQQVLDDKASGHFDASQIGTYRDALDARDQWRTVAKYVGVGALGALALGGALYVFDKPSVVLGAPAAESGPKPQRPASDMTEVSVAPWLGPGITGAAVGGRF